MAKLEEKYKKEELHNHIYNTPDTYIGGCDLITELLPLFNSENKKIEFKETEYIPGLFNIFNDDWLDDRADFTSLFFKSEIVSLILLLAKLKSELFFSSSSLFEDF